jgi:glycine cleavage system H protein
MEIQGYNLPDDLYYEEHHFWVRDDGDILVMGMDDFGRQMAGEIVYVQLPEEGKKITAGKKFAKMESGKWLGKIYGPVNGELVAVNEELEEDPGLINADCYGKGWMFKIKPDDKAEIQNLIKDPEAMEKWVLADIEKYAQDA